MKKIEFVVLFFLYFFTCNVFAGEVSITLPYTITQDSQGFIWVGTQTEAIRYDGHKKIKTAENIGYINRIITTEDTTYIAGDKAIIAIDKQLNEHTIYTAKHNDNIVDVVIHKNKLYVLQQKQLVLLSSLSHDIFTKTLLNFKYSQKGLIASNNNQICIITHAVQYRCVGDDDNNKPSDTLYFPDSIISMAKQNNALYFSTEHALYVKGSPSHQLTLVAEFTNKKLSAIAKGNKPNHLWLSINNKPELFDSVNKKFVMHNFIREKDSRITNIFQSADSTLWIASNKLEAIANTNLHIQKIQGINSTSGMAWLIEDDGITSLFDIDGGYNIDLDGVKAIPLPHVEKTTKGYIFTALKMVNSVWVGGLNGLFKNNYRLTKIENLSHLIAKQPVQCIRKISYQHVAVCVANVGVYLINIHTYESQLVIANDKLNSIVDVVPIDGSLHKAWLATDKGVYYYENNKLTQYLPDSHAIRLAQHDNTLMIATIDDGLFSLTKIGKAFSIKHIALPSLGLHINDIKFDGSSFFVSTGLGIGKFNSKTKKISTWPLNKSIGRISDSGRKLKAMSGDGELITWPRDLEKGATFKSDIVVSRFAVNGVRKPISEVIATESYIEFGISTNDYSNPQLQKYKIKVNNNPWSSYSDINNIGFSPKLGSNTIQIKAKANQHISRTIEFYVALPWYFSAPAKVLFSVLFFALIFTIGKLYVENRRRFIAQGNSYNDALEKLSNEHCNKVKTIIQQHKIEFKQTISALMQKDNIAHAKFFTSHPLSLNLETIDDMKEINKIQFLLKMNKPDLAQDAIDELLFQKSMDSINNQPNIIFNNDIVRTTQRLVVSQQSKKQFLMIDVKADNVNKPRNDYEKEVHRIMYKCIYQLSSYLVEQTPSIDFTIVIEQKSNYLIVEFLISDYELKKESFSKANIGLFQVKVVAPYMNGALSVSSVDDESSKIKLTMPLVEKTKQKNI